MIYLDHHASTTVRPEALERLLASLSEGPGNPHVDTHRAGAGKSRQLECAREAIAKTSGFLPGDVIVTSGATESNNLIVAGLASALREQGRPGIVTLSTEHKCILEAVHRERAAGSELHELPVDSHGYAVVPEDLDWDRVGLLCVMGANNEIGTISALPVSIVDQARSRGVLAHCDAAQLPGRVPLRALLARFDSVSLSGHKFGAPTGIGVLIARRSVRLRLQPHHVGGGQQAGLRSGTVPVALATSFAAALAAADGRVGEDGPRLRRLAEQFCSELESRDVAFVLRGPALQERLPGNLNITFTGVDAMALSFNLREKVAFSLGAACQTKEILPSHVLVAIGLSEVDVEQTVRFGFGWDNTDDEVSKAAAMVAAAVTELRQI